MRKFYILLFALCLALVSPTPTFADNTVPIDSLFYIFDLKPNKKLASQLIDSFNLYECYDYPIQKKSHYNEQFSYMLSYLGMANYSYNQGSFYSAERYSNVALSLIHPDSLRWISSCYEVLNVAQQRIGQYQKALENAKNDYDIGEKLNDFRIQSSALNSLATINLATGHPAEALEYIDKAIDLERKHNNDNEKALSIRLGNKSEVLMALDRPDEALECVNEAIDIDFNHKRMNKYYIRISQKADILLHQQKWNECRSLCLEALKAFEKNNDLVNEIITLKQLGMCEMSAKNYESAEKYLLKGESLCKKINFMPLLWRIQGQLSKLYKDTYRTDKAIAYLQSSFDIKDSLNSEKYQNLLSEYQVAYETHQKDEQIKQQESVLQRHLYLGGALVVLLTLSTILVVVYSRLARLRRLSNEVLVENTKTRNQIFSIVSYDLRNPVNAQKQMLDNICNFYDKIPDDDKRNMIVEIQKSNQALSELLVNLLEWASLETGRFTFKPIRVDLSSVVNKEIYHLRSLCDRKSVEVQKNVPNDIIVFSDINFLEIIIRNLLINAIKYSYENGIVEISVDDSKDFVTIYVKDHGKGMMEDEKDKIFKKEYVTTPGTSGETGTGIGLMVCKELVEKNGGKIDFTSEFQRGSTFYFTTPKVKDSSINNN